MYLGEFQTATDWEKETTSTYMRMVMAIFMLDQPLQLHALLRQTKRPMMFVSYSLMQPV